MTARRILLVLALTIGPAIAASAQVNLAPQRPAPAANPAAKQPERQPPAKAAAPAKKSAPAPQQAAAPQPAAPAGPANALQGFSKNRDQPVKIGANSLEVRDKDKQATFKGDVQLVQGDTTLRCASMVVFYDDDSAKTTKSTMTTAASSPGGQQKIKRVEARGGVRITQADQTATGDSGTFDMQANTVTLHGNVTIVRGSDILRGQRLVVDMTSGVSRMEAAPGTGGRVEGMFKPSSGNSLGLPGRDSAKSPQRVN